MDASVVSRAKPAVRRYRWLVCLVAWACFTASFVDRLAWSNLQLGVGQSLGLPIAALGAFVSAFYAGYVLSNAIGGYLADRLGPSLVLACSTGLLGAATMLFSTTSSVPSGLALQAVMGLCAGADYAAGIKLLTAWFAPTERGRAIGLWFTGSSLAVVITNALVPAIDARLGWGGTYRALGAATLATALLAGLLLRDGPEAGAARARPDIGALLRDRDLLLVALAGFGALWGTWGFAFWANALMVRGAGLPPSRAAAIVATFGVGAALAKPLVGWLSDRLGGRRKPLALLCLASFAALLLLFGSLSGEAAFWAAAPLLGVAAFSYSPLMAAMVAEIAGKAQAGSASGATNALWQLGSALVPLAVGGTFGATGSFPAAFAALACGPLVGLAALATVRERPRATPAP